MSKIKLTPNMQRAVNVLAAHQLMGRPWAEARNAADGNALNGLRRRDLLEDGLGYDATQYLNLVGCALAQDAEVFDYIRRYRQEKERAIEALQGSLRTAQNRLISAIEATANSGHDVVRVEVRFTTWDSLDPVPMRKFTGVVRSDLDDKSAAFKEWAIARAREGINDWLARKFDFDGPVEVSVTHRYTLGPVRGESWEAPWWSSCSCGSSQKGD